MHLKIFFLKNNQNLIERMFAILFIEKLICSFLLYRLSVCKVTSSVVVFRNSIFRVSSISSSKRVGRKIVGKSIYCFLPIIILLQI